MKRVTLGLAQAVNLFVKDTLNRVDLFEPVSRLGGDVMLGAADGYKKIIPSMGKIQSVLTRGGKEVVLKEKQISPGNAQVVIAAVAGEMGGKLSAAQREDVGFLNLLTDVFNAGEKNVFVS